MSSFKIITDSASDLPLSVLESLDVDWVELNVYIDGKNYDYDGSEESVKKFYDEVRSGMNASTSAANSSEFTELMEKYLKQGKDVLYIGFSSGLSSTYNSGVIAADELREKYPDRKIYTVSSLCASLGEGLLVYLAARKQKDGCTIEETRGYAESIKLNLCHWFTVDDLFHLKRGGRVSATTAVVGSMLNIKPILHVDDEGHLINVGKARGRKASIKELVVRMKELAIDPENQTVFISHGDCYDDAAALAEMVKKEFNVKDVLIGYIGPVIGAHSGPGTVALFFLGSHR